jgi:hypothetical protein
MQKISLFLFLIGSLAYLPACDELDERAIDNKKMIRAMQDRKPQRITPKNLQDWVKRKGEAWCFLAQKDLYRQVKRALANNTLKKTTDFDTLPPLPVVDSLMQQYSIEMQGYSFSKKYDLPEEVQTMLKTYQQKEASREALVKESKDKVYFTTPILLDNEMVGAWLISFPIKQARRWYDYRDLR